MTPADLHAWLVARWTERSRSSDNLALSPFESAVDRKRYRWISDVCDAALRRLARHQPLSRPFAEPYCRSKCIIGGDGGIVFWPCPEVLDDAAPWAERSDFPEELRRV